MLNGLVIDAYRCHMPIACQSIESKSKLFSLRGGIFGIPDYSKSNVMTYVDN